MWHYKKSYNKNIYGQTLNFEISYHKITYISGNKDFINMQICIYSDNKKEYSIDQKDYSFTPFVESGTDNFIKQGYDYLKTLDEYNDEVDC